MRKKDLNLKIGWLYPELMSTYGDRGNILVLQKRAQWREIETTVIRINEKTHESFLEKTDILFMGGAQDIQQEIVQKDLNGPKGKMIANMIEGNTPGLFICGAYQFLGNYYKDSYGVEIPGLGIFDMHTQSPADNTRMVGNIIVKPTQILNDGSSIDNYLVGFENHGGKTYLKNKDQAFAKVIKGYGNNSEDETEGIHYKSTIGTYLHGPILPSNPQLADYILENALVNKYGKEIKLKKLNDAYASEAKVNMLKRLKTSY